MGRSEVRGWFKTVFDPQLSEQGTHLLLLDSFSGQGKNAQISSLTNKQLIVDYIPKGTTYLCQPCDLGLFRQLKGLVRPMVNMCRLQFLSGHSKLKPKNRLFIIVCQSLAHNQLRAECFVQMLKKAWKIGGYSLCDEITDYFTVTQICFKELTSNKCTAENCQMYSFIRCAYCMLCYCYSHFVLAYHYHAINEPEPDYKNIQQLLQKFESQEEDES